MSESRKTEGSSTVNYNAKEILEMAVQTERAAADFYDKVSRTTQNDKLRGLFAFLADEERKHVQVFESVGRAFADSSREQPYNWEEAALYLKAITDSRYFLGGSKVPDLAREASTPTDCLKVALSFEKETALFYHELTDIVGPDARPAVIALIAQERNHIRRIQELIDAITACPPEPERRLT